MSVINYYTKLPSKFLKRNNGFVLKRRLSVESTYYYLLYILCYSLCLYPWFEFVSYVLICIGFVIKVIGLAQWLERSIAITMVIGSIPPMSFLPWFVFVL